MVSHMRFSKDDAALEPPIRTWVQSMFEHATGVEVQLSELITKHCHMSVAISAKYLRSKVEETAKVSGGHPETSGRWYDGLDVSGPQVSLEAVVAHAERTLFVAQGEYIDICKKLLKEVEQQYSSCLYSDAHDAIMHSHVL